MLGMDEKEIWHQVFWGSSAEDPMSRSSLVSDFLFFFVSNFGVVKSECKVNVEVDSEVLSFAPSVGIFG